MYSMDWISRLRGRTRAEVGEPRSDKADAGRRAGESGSNVAAKPIRTAEADLLGRARAARTFAEQVLSFPAIEGVVVGVLGPWGSGKTSFVNLARGHLHVAGVEVLDFNPWMFSGAEQLVNSFF